MPLKSALYVLIFKLHNKKVSHEVPSWLRKGVKADTYSLIAA